MPRDSCSRSITPDPALLPGCVPRRDALFQYTPLKLLEKHPENNFAVAGNDKKRSALESSLLCHTPALQITKHKTIKHTIAKRTHATGSHRPCGPFFMRQRQTRTLGPLSRPVTMRIYAMSRHCIHPNHMRAASTSIRLARLCTLLQGCPKRDV